MELHPGTTLGSYEIVGPLGAGAMGAVYRARDPRLGRSVAIKIVSERALLVPLDFEAIAASVRKTSRVLIVHEDKVHGGFGGEIAARIAAECFEFLDAPVERVGSTFTPVGFNRILERAILPSTEKVLEAARRILAY